ncbi:MAG: choice-of-anchor B family protein [Planctomycetota bacterium]
MLIRTAFCLGIAMSALPAQGVNCQLLGTLDQYGTYNDIWGYVAPNGKEYALVGVTTGTSVVDVTNPAAPVERGFFAGPTSTWRDIRTYSTYAYVVTEGGGGFQVIDLTNADAPTLVGTVGAAQFGNCHNICVDTGTGRIYCIGTNNGTPVFDAAANPANPPFVGNALPRNPLNPNSTYFHDMQVENGFAYGSMIYNGDLRIMNTAALPLPILSDIGTPGIFTHNAWPNAAGTICVTTDEINGGVVKFFDVTNKSAPVPLGQYTPNPGAIVHNAYIVGDVCHVSWYTEGYRAIDISDPNNPVEVASYDTWPGGSGTFDGAWGCYPFLPSGNVLINDISTGLYIVRPLITDMSLAHTPLADTGDEFGPYQVTATVTGSNPLSSVNLVYRVGAGAPVTVAMTPTGNPNEFGAAIPGQDALVEIEYHIDAQDSVAGRRSPLTGEHAFLVGTRTRVFFDDCESDLGWTHAFVATQDDWQRGSPNGASGSSAGFGWSDPGAAFSGNACWGNDLAPAGFNGSYQNNVNNFLQSPILPTNGVQGLRFRYQRWISLNSGDQGRVLVNGIVVATVNGPTNDTSWQLIEHDITAIANPASTLQLRFELITDAGSVAGGWALDDIEIFSETDSVPPTFYGAGTAGSGGFVPQIALLSPAGLGQIGLVEGSDLLGGTFAILSVGFAEANFPALGVQVLVDTNGGGFYLWAPAFGAAGVPGAGTAQWALNVPNDPNLDNLYVFTQVGTFDAGSVGGSLAASQGMRFRVCIN